MREPFLNETDQGSQLAAARYHSPHQRKVLFAISDLRAPDFFLLKGKENFLLASALTEQGGGASLRLGRGGILHTPFRLALALDADGICASVSWRAAIVEVLVAVEVVAGVASVAEDPL